LKVTNFAPDSDVIRIDSTDGNWTIFVGRDEDATVSVTIEDHKEGSVTDLVLGEPGETQKVG